MRFACCVGKQKNIPRIVEAHEENLTGLYGWLKAFNGDIVSFDDMDKKALEYYDIVHVNMIAWHASMPLMLRNMLGNDSSTLLTANVDYSIEMIPSLFGYKGHDLGNVSDSLRACDVVFCQESRQKEMFEAMTKRHINLIPHPCNVEFIKGVYTPPETRKKEIACMFHKCHPDTIVWHWLALNYNYEPYKSILYGMRKLSTNRMTYGKFDRVEEVMKFPKFIDELSKSYIAIDLYQMHVFGRFVIDCAALGIPVVGSHYVDAMDKLFPKLKVDPFDLRAIRRKINRLLKDKKYYNEHREYAEQHVDYYSLDNSVKRFMEAIENARKEKEKTIRKER